MEAFSALLAICAGNSPVPGEFPTQRPVTQSFEVFFDLHLNKQLSKQSWGWWLEMLSRPLWRHRNETKYNHSKLTLMLNLFQKHKNISMASCKTAVTPSVLAMELVQFCTKPSIFAFSVILQHWDGTGRSNLSSWKIRACLSCIFNMVTADVLVTLKVKASAITVLT